MVSETLDKLKKNKKFHEYLRQNSDYYKLLNRSDKNYNKFINDMKKKYKLRAIDKVDNFVDSVDLITKIIDSSK